MRLLRVKLDFQGLFSALFLLICCNLAVAPIRQVLFLFLVLIRNPLGLWPVFYTSFMCVIKNVTHCSGQTS